MSLINQMLRDLEARQAAETGKQGSVFRGLNSGTMPRRRSPLLMGAIVVGIAVVAGVGAWFVMGRMHHPAQQVAVQNPPPLPRPAVATKPSPEAKVTPATTVQAAPTHVAPSSQPSAPAPQPTPQRQRVPQTGIPAVAVIKKKTAEPRHRTTPAYTTVAAGTGVEIRRRAPTLHQQAVISYQDALTLLRRHDNEAAELKLRQSLRLDPAYADPAEALGALLINQGRSVEAAPIVDASRRINTERPTLELLAARIRLAQGDIKGATTLLENGLSFSGGRADYVAFLAALYQKQGRYGDSVLAYKKAVTLNPGSAAWWAGLGISEEGAGNSRDAADAYSRALRGDLPETLRTYAEQRLQALHAQQPAGTETSPGLH